MCMRISVEEKHVLLEVASFAIIVVILYAKICKFCMMIYLIFYFLIRE